MTAADLRQKLLDLLGGPIGQAGPQQGAGDSQAVLDALALSAGMPQVQFANRAATITAAGQVADGILTNAKISPTAAISGVKIAGRWYRGRAPAAGTAIGAAVAAAQVGYFPIDGSGGAAGNAENTAQIQAEPGTVKAPRVYLSANAATGGTMALRVGAADSAGVKNLAAAGTGWIDIPLAAGVVLAAGDLIALRVSPTGGAITIQGVVMETDS